MYPIILFALFLTFYLQRLGEANYFAIFNAEILNYSKLQITSMTIEYTKAYYPKQRLIVVNRNKTVHIFLCRAVKLSLIETN
jgi:hypothetical protein